jgi:hypothetical protein
VRAVPEEAKAKRPLLPGYRTAVLFLWLATLSPVLLLVASVATIGLGLWRDADGVAAVGAAGLLAALLLPAMTGEFELPGGIKGTLDGGWRELVNKGIEQGAPPAKAIELASDAVDAVGSTRQLTRDSVRSARSELANQLVEMYMGQGLHLYTAANQVVGAIAAERAWQIDRDVPVDTETGRRVLDFVLSTNGTKIAIETAVAPGAGWIIAKAHETAQAAQEIGADLTFLVVRDIPRAPRPEENVEVLTLPELEARLRAID